MSLIMGALAGLGAGAANVGAEMQKAADVAERDKRVSDLELNRQATMERLKLEDELNKRWSTMAGVLGAPSSTGGAPAQGATPAASATPTAPAGGDGATVQPTSKSDAINAQIADLSKRFKIPEEIIRSDLFANGGKGIAKMLDDRTRPEMMVVNGVAMDKNSLKPGVVPSVNTSADGKTSFIEAGPDGRPVVSVPQGAESAFGTYQGIQAGIKSATTPMKVFNPETQREEFVPESSVLKAAGGGQPGQEASAGGKFKVSPQEQAARDADAIQIKRSELKLAQSQLADAEARGDQVAANRARGDIDAVSREISRSEQQAARGSAEKPGASGAMAAGPSSTEKATAEALPELNKDFINKSYRPTMDALPAAQRAIESVKSARSAMEAMGGTGFGRETTAKLASVAVGLGFDMTRARMLAQNSEKFKSEMSSHLLEVLKLQNGVQTEGDAQRASDTFAKFGNTTEANRFILDMAQAVATRDVMKAQFYSDMLPEAKRTGDYSSIDREWARVAPSVFSFPTLKRWGVQQ
jgi:hypothetical protein